MSDPMAEECPACKAPPSEPCDCSWEDWEAAKRQPIRDELKEARREAFMDGYVLGAAHATESFLKAADRRNRDDYFPAWHRLRYGY